MVDDVSLPGFAGPQLEPTYPRGMGRGNGAWAVGTVITLSLAAWASSAGPTLPSAISPDRGNRPPGPPVDFEVGQDDRVLPGLHLDKLGDSDVMNGLIIWASRIVLALAGALVVLVIFLLVRNLIRRLRGAVVAPKDDVSGDLLPEVLRAGVARSSAELERGEAGEAVINAWLRLEDTARVVGIEDDTSRTPAELVSTVLENYDVERESLERLAEVYREARFSVHPIGEAQRETARVALQRIRDDLERPLLATGPGVGSENR